MRRTRRMTIPAVAAGFLTLTACTTGGTTGTATPDVDEATPGTTTDASPTETAADADGVGECLEGEWAGNLRIAERTTLGTLQVGDLEVEPEVETSGESLVTFDGSTMTTEYQDQTTTVSLSPADAEGELVITTTLNGSTSSSYTVEGETLTVDDVDVSDLTTENTADLGGTEYDLPGLEDTQAESFAVDTAFTVDCSEDELRLTPVVDEVPLPDETDAPDAPDEDDVEEALEMVLTRR